MTSYEREREQRAHLEKAVASNRRSVELSRELCVAGLSDFLSVLEAQNALYTSENELVKARPQWPSTWWLFARLSEAVGKGTSSRVCNGRVVLNPWMFFCGIVDPGVRRSTYCWRRATDLP